MYICFIILVLSAAIISSSKAYFPISTGIPSDRQLTTGVNTTAISGGFAVSWLNQARNKTYWPSVDSDTRTTFGLLHASPFPEHVSAPADASEADNKQDARTKTRVVSGQRFGNFMLCNQGLPMDTTPSFFGEAMPKNREKASFLRSYYFFCPFT